ncbi:unnamed protein product [Cuscuta campestris]|uniref:Uncharacterized protein n=1 Tax=Cuscuta campestris TaxID=132261 RepID=A0A484MHK6_9ASTE|nr:unnamed protein product [Cuscuta campestris]
MIYPLCSNAHSHHFQCKTKMTTTMCAITWPILKESTTRPIRSSEQPARPRRSLFCRSLIRTKSLEKDRFFDMCLSLRLFIHLSLSKESIKLLPHPDFFYTSERD